MFIRTDLIHCTHACDYKKHIYKEHLCIIQLFILNINGDYIDCLTRRG